MKKKELIEEMADISHYIWIDWTEHFFNNQSEKNIKRWKRQCKTPYIELSEKEKEADRKIARKYYNLFMCFYEPKTSRLIK